MSARSPPPLWRWSCTAPHRTKYVYSGDADPSVPGGASEFYRDLVSNEARLQQIYDDVMAAYAANSRIRLLTIWKAHLERFRVKFAPMPDCRRWFFPEI